MHPEIIPNKTRIPSFLRKHKTLRPPQLILKAKEMIQGPLFSMSMC